MSFNELAFGCLKKRRYISEEVAINKSKALLESRKVMLRSYYCGICLGFHLTKKGVATGHARPIAETKAKPEAQDRLLMSINMRKRQILRGMKRLERIYLDNAAAFDVVSVASIGSICNAFESFDTKLKGEAKQPAREGSGKSE